MAEITEIISKEAIESIKTLDRLLTDADSSIMRIVDHAKQLDASLKGSGSIKEVNTATKQLNDNVKRLNEATKQRVQIDKEAERATKKQADALAKLAAKQREHTEALSLEVKSVGDALRQNKALTIERNKAATSLGKQSKEVQDLNKRMQQNTEFIRANGTAAEKQRMNIGNYASAFNGLKTAAIGVAGALGLGVGIAGVTKVLGGIIASTDATADAFGRTVSGLREQANYFARAIVNMDFSNFIEGMREARKEGERYYDTLDLIEDKQRALGLQKQDIEAQILEQKLIAKNKRNELSVRQAAIDEIIRLEQLKRDKSKALADESLNNEITNAASLAKVHGQYKQEIVDFVKNYDQNLDKIKKGDELINKIRQQNTKVVSVDQYGNQVTSVNRNQELIDRSRLNAADREALRMAEYNKTLTKEKRDLIAESIGLQQSANIDQKQGELELVRLRNSLYNELIKEEKQQDRVGEKQKTAIQLLTEKITELRSQLEVSILMTGKAPDGLVREIMGSEAELERVKKQVTDILAPIAAMQGRGVTGVTSGSTGGGLTPRATPSPSGAPPGTESGIFGDWTRENTLEAVEITANASLDIIRNADQAAFDNKMSLLEKEKEAKLKNANLTEKQRAKIEADFEKKSAKLKQEQFKKEKAASIIQAIINTAVAIAKVASNPPQAILAGLVGAAQIAVIASQKVPEFDKGTMSTPANFIAGEKRPEWLRMPSGQWRYVDRPTMFKNLRGSTVISGEQTERLKKAGIRPDQTDIRPDIARMEQSIVRTIQQKKELHLNARTGRVTDREGNYYKNYINRLYQWAGKN